MAAGPSCPEHQVAMASQGPPATAAGTGCGSSASANGSGAEAPEPTPAERGWQASAWLQLPAPPLGHRAGSTAPLRWQRAFTDAEDGRLQLPLLHTAGGLVGGDRLDLRLQGAAGSRGLITTVAAQKVYGSRGRFRQAPEHPRWAEQRLQVELTGSADLEWLPQELVLYGGGLLRQHTRVELSKAASWLGAEVMRLGRSAAAETLGDGCLQSSLEVVRLGAGGERRWELVDRLQLEGEALSSPHGMDGAAVLGTLVWAAPSCCERSGLEALVQQARQARSGLEGEMAVGLLEQGLIARYRGPSSQAARFWFSRIWLLSRRLRLQPAPQLPRVWPFQEQPLSGWSPVDRADASADAPEAPTELTR
jgi:urease accessory protein